MSLGWQHLSPVILTDEVFFKYQPDIVFTGSFAMREFAYLMAEQQVIEHLGAPLLPTTMTGTYMLQEHYGRLRLEYGWLESVQAVRMHTRDGCDCDLTTHDGCSVVLDSRDGIILPIRTSTSWNAYCNCYQPRSALFVDVAFTAGLPTGIAADDTSLHAALSITAKRWMDEIYDPAALEGGAGNPGIKSYNALGYSETRNEVAKTVFGQTAIGNMVIQMLRHLRRPQRALRIPRRRF